ncbi:hypothetical protein BJ322DRAFT_1021634 [Thelephora terrestris]|uniref:Uncharacterized protein n=1 Tax=Thelephora terrestris TaxID=56493 RepID=A0A9P6HC44_9AGAM|nr:hypothetical protein BJ322DRAFT_1021634 [Thelephora terrestris]
MHPAHFFLVSNVIFHYIAPDDRERTQRRGSIIDRNGRRPPRGGEPGLGTSLRILRPKAFTLTWRRRLSIKITSPRAIPVVKPVHDVCIAATMTDTTLSTTTAVPRAMASSINDRPKDLIRPPEPKACKTLPPEIMDDVLEYIPLDREGRKVLIACVSVATWWARPSQRRLFSSVSLDDENYLQWMEGVALPILKTHLLRYVRSILLGLYGKADYSTQDISRDSGGYLSALHNLRSLTLCNVALLSNGQEEIHTCFSAFRETLRIEIFTLVLDFGSIVVDAEALESFLQSIASSVKYLKLEATLRRGTALTGIGNFRQLREFELLSSAQSRYFTQGTEAWGPLDKELCQLVTRLGRAGYRRSLEVELRPSKIRDGDFSPREIDFTRVLPKFRERGFVTIAYRNACDSDH